MQQRSLFQSKFFFSANYEIFIFLRVICAWTFRCSSGVYHYEEQADAPSALEIVGAWPKGLRPILRLEGVH